MTHWEQIVSRHCPIVWQTALRLLGNQRDAADCFQETFICAMEISQREPVANWPGLLQRVATTRALDMIRKRLLARQRHPSGNDLAAIVSPGIEPLSQLQNNELAHSLSVALARLPAQQAHGILQHARRRHHQSLRLQGWKRPHAHPQRPDRDPPRHHPHAQGNAQGHALAP